MKFYQLTSDIARLMSYSDTLKSIELPFEMSHEEDRIVRHDGSLFILGRSGTGKTTVILHRMFLVREVSKRAQEKKLKLKDSASSVNRQLLVTASPLLCEAIKRSFQNLCDTADASAANNTKSTPQPPSAHTEVVRGDGNDPSAALHSFADCTPNSYPLIITFKKFLSMLNNSLPVSYWGRVGEKGRIEVDFERFLTQYYVHFATELRAVGDAAMLYSECMSQIKGSMPALKSERGYLSREEYLVMSDQRHSTLDVVQRGLVYSAFEKYKQMRLEFPADYGQSYSSQLLDYLSPHHHLPPLSFRLPRYCASRIRHDEKVTRFVSR